MLIQICSHCCILVMAPTCAPNLLTFLHISEHKTAGNGARCQRLRKCVVPGDQRTAPKVRTRRKVSIVNVFCHWPPATLAADNDRGTFNYHYRTCPIRLGGALWRWWVNPSQNEASIFFPRFPPRPWQKDVIPQRGKKNRKSLASEHILRAPICTGQSSATWRNKRFYHLRGVRARSQKSAHRAGKINSLSKAAVAGGNGKTLIPHRCSQQYWRTHNAGHVPQASI